MPWEDTLHLEGKGSYNSVEFFVPSIESEIGRKTVVHDFPQRNFSSPEDLGRKGRKFRLTCYIVGPEYFIGRDKLRKEFELPGPGQLNHPTWGNFKATIISPVRMRETSAEGGMVRFDLEIIEVEDSPIQTIVVGEPDVTEKALAADTAISEEFEASFNITSAIQSVRSSAASSIEVAAAKMREARGAVNASIDVVNSVSSSIDDLSNLASSLINTPELLIQTIIEAHAAIFDDISDVGEEVAELIAGGQKDIEAVDGSSLFADFRATRALETFTDLATNLDELPAVQDTGSTQTTIENLNQTALQEAFQTSAVIAACRAFAAFDFESRDKAIEARDSITLRLSELAENASDTVYGPLVDLRSAISTHLLNVAQALPQVVEIILQEPQPSVVVMYDIYGNLDDETDFLIRNKIENPAAVPALKVLEVLADG